MKLDSNLYQLKFEFPHKSANVGSTANRVEIMKNSMDQPSESVEGEGALNGSVTEGVSASNVTSSQTQQTIPPAIETPVSREMLQTLLAMGYTEDLSEKALRLCNNESTTAALDVINELRKTLAPSDRRSIPVAGGATSMGGLSVDDSFLDWNGIRKPVAIHAAAPTSVSGTSNIFKSSFEERRNSVAVMATARAASYTPAAAAAAASDSSLVPVPANSSYRSSIAPSSYGPPPSYPRLRSEVSTQLPTSSSAADPPPLPPKTRAPLPPPSPARQQTGLPLPSPSPSSLSAASSLHPVRTKSHSVMFAAGDNNTATTEAISNHPFNPPQQVQQMFRKMAAAAPPTSVSVTPRFGSSRLSKETTAVGAAAASCETAVNTIGIGSSVATSSAAGTALNAPSSRGISPVTAHPIPGVTVPQMFCQSVRRAENNMPRPQFATAPAAPPYPGPSGGGAGPGAAPVSSAQPSNNATSSSRTSTLRSPFTTSPVTVPFGTPEGRPTPISAWEARQPPLVLHMSSSREIPRRQPHTATTPPPPGTDAPPPSASSAALLSKAPPPLPHTYQPLPTASTVAHAQRESVSHSSTVVPRNGIPAPLSPTPSPGVLSQSQSQPTSSLPHMISAVVSTRVQSIANTMTVESYRQQTPQFSPTAAGGGGGVDRAHQPLTAQPPVPPRVKRRPPPPPPPKTALPHPNDFPMQNDITTITNSNVSHTDPFGAPSFAPPQILANGFAQQHPSTPAAATTAVQYQPRLSVASHSPPPFRTVTSSPYFNYAPEIRRNSIAQSTNIAPPPVPSRRARPVIQYHAVPSSVYTPAQQGAAAAKITKAIDLASLRAKINPPRVLPTAYTHPLYDMQEELEAQLKRDDYTEPAGQAAPSSKYFTAAAVRNSPLSNNGMNSYVCSPPPTPIDRQRGVPERGVLVERGFSPAAAATAGTRTSYQYHPSDSESHTISSSFSRRPPSYADACSPSLDHQTANQNRAYHYVSQNANPVRPVPQSYPASSTGFVTSPLTVLPPPPPPHHPAAGISPQFVQLDSYSNSPQYNQSNNLPDSGSTKAAATAAGTEAQPVLFYQASSNPHFPSPLKEKVHVAQAAKPPHAAGASVVKQIRDNNPQFIDPNVLDAAYIAQTYTICRNGNQAATGGVRRVSTNAFFSDGPSSTDLEALPAANNVDYKSSSPPQQPPPIPTSSSQPQKIVSNGGLAFTAAVTATTSSTFVQPPPREPQRQHAAPSMESPTRNALQYYAHESPTAAVMNRKEHGNEKQNKYSSFGHDEEIDLFVDTTSSGTTAEVKDIHISPLPERSARSSKDEGPSDLELELASSSSLPLSHSDCDTPLNGANGAVASSSNRSNKSSIAPQAFKFFMEQRMENLEKERLARQSRLEGLESEMMQMKMRDEDKVRVREILFKKETQYLRSKRANKMDKSMFTEINILGTGAFGDVYLVQKNDTRNLYALKRLKKREVLERNQMAHVKAERDILIEANSEWVVQLYYSFQDEEQLYFVMEFIPGGDLMSLLIKLSIFSEELARFYTAELVLALESVHQLGFSHRDVKPDNILIHKDGHIKLTDFGLCTGFRWYHKSKYYQSGEGGASKYCNSLRQSDPEHLQMCRQCEGLKPLERRKKHRQCYAKSLVGTPNYISPEILDPGLHEGYTKCCDWWSVGVILYEMVVGQPPFLAETSLETQEKVLRWRSTLRIPSDCRLSFQCIDLIRSLCADAKDRLGRNGAAEIKSHPWFSMHINSAAIDFENIRYKPAPYIPPLCSEWDTSNFDPVDPLKLRSHFTDSPDATAAADLAHHPAAFAFLEFTYKRFFESPHTVSPSVRGDSVYV